MRTLQKTLNNFMRNINKSVNIAMFRLWSKQSLIKYLPMSFIRSLHRCKHHLYILVWGLGKCNVSN